MSNLNIECLEILHKEQYSNLLNDSNRQIEKFDYQLETTGAFIYKLSENIILLIPNDIISQGILFKSKKCFEDYLAVESLPIENIHPKIEETFQDLLFGINSDIEYVVKKVLEYLNLEIEVETVDDSSLNLLLLRIRREKDVLNGDALFLGSLLFGELVRRKKVGRWVLMKRYGSYNKYYTPMILFDEDSIFPFLEYYELYLLSSMNSVNDFLDMQHISRVKLSLNMILKKDEIIILGQ